MKHESGSVGITRDQGLEVGNYAPAGQVYATVTTHTYMLHVEDMWLAKMGTLDRDGGFASRRFEVNHGSTPMAQEASVWIGPFMEVKLASSSTKMVVGGVCLEGREPSETMLYMDNASEVLTASAASIYIEGGFGKLTLQSGDYAGAVSAIGGAGNAADVHADGLVVVASGTGILGANPYLAVDLSSGDILGDIELVAGGAVSFAGLSGAMDIELADGGLSSAIGTNIEAWDLGLTYQMGDLALAFATDDDNDWGLSASMDVAGFDVNATFTSESGDHEKSGIMYSVSAATTLNGFGLSAEVDQRLLPKVGLSYSIGALELSLSHFTSKGGGRLGAKLSF